MTKPKLFLLLFIIPCLVFPDVKANITNRNGRWLTINKGSRSGLTVGLRGKVKMNFVDQGRTFEITLGLVLVKSVKSTSAIVYIERLGAGANLQDAQFVVIDSKRLPAVNTSKSSNRSLEWYLDQGDVCFNKNQYSRAKVYYNKVLEIDPEDPIALEKRKACEQYLEDSLGLGKFNEYLRKGDYYCQKKKYEYALKYYLAALKTIPSNSSIIKTRFEIVRGNNTVLWTRFYNQNREALEHIKLDDRIKKGKRSKVITPQSQNVKTEKVEAQINGRILAISAVDSRPQITHKYPMRLHKDLRRKYNQRIFDIRVILLIDIEGKVRKVKIVSELYKDVKKPVEKAFLKWTFRPALKDGKAVMVWLPVQYRFRIFE